MGVDGIGGSGPGGPWGPGRAEGGAGSPWTEGTTGADGGQGLEGAGAADAAARPEGPADVDRARLERGELGIDEYLDLQVERATAHLADRTPPAALEMVRSELREQLAADPLLRALSEHVVGRQGSTGAGR